MSISGYVIVKLQAPAWPGQAETKKDWLVREIPNPKFQIPNKFETCGKNILPGNGMISRQGNHICTAKNQF
jgi:hypothetical protein